MLKVERLTKVFGSLVAVDNVTFEVPTGQMIGIIGRSGAGKSTLLRMINRLADPTSGRILCDDVFGADGDICALNTSSHRMRPEVGSASRLIMRSRVDLPAPERPMMPII